MPRDLDAPWVFVDPGVHASGVAWFYGRTLLTAQYRSEPLPSYTCGTMRETRCVCERPKVYDEETQARAGRRIRSADIEDLLIAAGRMTGSLPTEYVLPVQWKGTAKKETMHKRVPCILSDAELRILDQGLDGVAKSLHHNVYDAVCMGLKWLGRWR